MKQNKKKTKKQKGENEAHISYNEYGTIYILYNSIIIYIHIYIYLHSCCRNLHNLNAIQVSNENWEMLQYLQYNLHKYSTVKISNLVNSIVFS